MSKTPLTAREAVPVMPDATKPEPWTLPQALKLCRELESIAPAYGAHVALTGGCLYKDGERKDVDIMFYRIRQVNKIDVDGLFSELEDFGIKKTGGFGFVFKAVTATGKKIDFFFPEEEGEYTGDA